MLPDSCTFMPGIRMCILFSYFAIGKKTSNGFGEVCTLICVFRPKTDINEDIGRSPTATCSIRRVLKTGTIITK